MIFLSWVVVKLSLWPPQPCPALRAEFLLLFKLMGSEHTQAQLGSRSHRVEAQRRETLLNNYGQREKLSVNSTSVATAFPDSISSLSNYISAPKDSVSGASLGLPQGRVGWGEVQARSPCQSDLSIGCHLLPRRKRLKINFQDPEWSL